MTGASVETCVSYKWPTPLRWKRFLILMLMVFPCVFAPSIARANPVMLNPSSLFAFCIVAFWAMVVESGIVALLLAFRGAAALPVFFAYLILNGGVFLFLFEPLLIGSKSLPIVVLEAIVILVDGATIKLLITLNLFQGDDYRGVGWLRSLATSAVGNSLSYFVGYLGTQKPWEMAS
jgi:hypothetical protein